MQRLRASRDGWKGLEDDRLICETFVWVTIKGLAVVRENGVMHKLSQNMATTPWDHQGPAKDGTMHVNTQATRKYRAKLYMEPKTRHACVPPSTAAMASTVVRTMLLYGSCSHVHASNEFETYIHVHIVMRHVLLANMCDRRQTKRHIVATDLWQHAQ